MAYVIGSEKGKNIAQSMKTGESYKCSDGSTWTKQSDGSVSVKHNGQTYNNAYPASSSSGGSSSGGSSSNYSGSYTPLSSGGSSSGSSNKNSQYTGSSTGIKTNNSYQQSIKNQMNANSIAWWSADEAGKRQLEEANRILAKKLGGTVSYDDASGTWSGIAERDWEKDYNEDNPRPTQPERDPRIDAILNEILNRDDFSYDVMNDPLYQQYAKMYQREGDRAMKETMAEAAAGAGGMNTYAITAAQQANSYYNSQLNDRIPELYQLAYDMYINDKESKVQDLGILQNMDATQYNRYRDTINDYYNDKNFAYGVYQDAVQQNNWQTEHDYKSKWDNIYFDNDNYWKNKDLEITNREWDYNTSTVEKDNAYKRVMELIASNVTTIEAIGPELIKQAGLTEAAVNQMIAAKQAELLKKNSKTSDYVEDEEDRLIDEDDMSDYAVTNGNSESWVVVTGLGRLTWQELATMVENGTVVEKVDKKNKRISYVKAEGNNKAETNELPLYDYKPLDLYNKPFWAR